MFNLEQAIADWRQKMLAGGIATPVPLEELELHLREEMERQVRAGLNPQEAFEKAAHSIGEARVLNAEFKKIPAKPPKRLFQIFCVTFVELMGCLICLHGIRQLEDTEFSFAYIGGSFSFENLLVGLVANLIMGIGSLAFGGWLIWRAGRSLKSMKLIVKVVLGSSVIAFGLILSTFLLPNLAKIMRDMHAPFSSPMIAIFIFGTIAATIGVGVLLNVLVARLKKSKN